MARAFAKLAGSGRQHRADECSHGRRVAAVPKELGAGGAQQIGEKQEASGFERRI
jgi:hypothetical protein